MSPTDAEMKLIAERDEARKLVAILWNHIASIMSDHSKELSDANEVMREWT